VPFGTKKNSQLVSATTQLKLLASDGKRYLTDMLDYNGIIDLGILHTRLWKATAEAPEYGWI
jgi:hypothetical protein